MIGRIQELIGRFPARWRLPVLAYLGCQLVLFVWWAAYYPGLTSYDSLAYIWHVTTGHWMANHSVPYDGLVWLSLRLSGGIALLTFLQTVALSAVLAYTASVLHDLGVRSRWAAVTAVAVVAFPPLGMFTVFVWKDVAYTIATVLAFAATGRLLARRQARGAARWRPAGLLALGLLGMVLFRNNGFLAVAIAAPILIVALAGFRRLAALATIVPIAISFALTGWLYPALGVEGARPNLTYATAYADISVAYAQRPDTFTPAELGIMSLVAPLDKWREGANCYNLDVLYNSLGKTAADRLNDELVGIWKSTLTRTPGVVIGARICRGSIAWSIFPGPASKLGRTATLTIEVAPDYFLWAVPGGRLEHSKYLSAVDSHPLAVPLHDSADWVYKALLVPQLEWLIWRAPFWCYLSYAAVGLLARIRRRPGLWALSAMVAAGQLSVLAANPAQLFRYMTGPMMVAMLSVPLLAVWWRERHTQMLVDTTMREQVSENV